MLCDGDCTQVELTVALLDHFVDGVSTTVIKLAEKVGLIIDLYALLKQDKLLHDSLKLSIARFLDRATCLLSFKTIESLGILMTPIQKNNA